MNSLCFSCYSFINTILFLLIKKKIVLITCCYTEYTGELWSLVFCLFGVLWVMPHKVLDLLASWKGRVANKVMMKFGMLYLYVICKPFGESLTNNRAFEGSEWSTTDLKMILLWVLFDWMAVCYHAILFLLYLILLITVFVLDVVFPSTHLVYWVASVFFNKFTD